MIEILNLVKTYQNLLVLDHFNLKIETGETLVILGRSGVGKSVLLRHILGLESPDSGTIAIEGVILDSLKGAERYEALKSMGMLFQSSALFDSLNVFENVAFYIHEHKVCAAKETEERVLQALHLVGLKDVTEKMPSDLSGGMKKRVALARLIVYRPTILLYDEPTTGLDPITAMNINDLIIKTQKELTATSIVVTHDINSAYTIADRIALLHEGQIAYVGPKEDFFKSELPLIRNFIENALPRGVA